MTSFGGARTLAIALESDLDFLRPSGPAASADRNFKKQLHQERIKDVHMYI
jgi:hypothetical protein